MLILISSSKCKGSNADNTIRACLYIQGGTDEEENSRRAMKRGYIARRLARRSVRKLRSFGASRAKPDNCELYIFIFRISEFHHFAHIL